MQIVIDIPEQMYLNAKTDTLFGGDIIVKAIKNGKPLTENKGEWVQNIHGKTICSVCGAERTQWYDDDRYCSHCGADMRKEQSNADKEYGVEIITHGNCMKCGKELTEGLFFCPECEAKQKAENYSIKTVTNAEEAEEYQISENISKGFEEFTKMMFKQGQAESENKE